MKLKYQEMMNQARGLLANRGKNIENTQNFLANLSNLSSSTQKLNILKMTNAEGWTIGMMIALNHADTTRHYLRLLKGLKDTGESTYKIFNLIETTNKNGWTLGMVIMCYQDPTTAMEYLSLLKELQVFNIQPNRILTHLKKQKSDGVTMGMLIARNQNDPVVQQYIFLLREILAITNASASEELCLLLSLTTKFGENFGKYIGQYQSVEAIQQYLDFLRILKKTNVSIVNIFSQIKGSVIHFVKKQNAEINQQLLDFLIELVTENHVFSEKIYSILIKTDNRLTVAAIIAKDQNHVTHDYYIVLLRKLTEAGLPKEKLMRLSIGISKHKNDSDQCPKLKKEDPSFNQAPLEIFDKINQNNEIQILENAKTKQIINEDKNKETIFIKQNFNLPFLGSEKEKIKPSELKILVRQDSEHTKKELEELKIQLHNQQKEIDDLHNQIKVQNNTEKEIPKQTSDLSTEIESLKNQFHDHLLKIQSNIPKFLDNLIAQGRTIDLKNLLIKSELYDLKNLCLIHIADTLDNTDQLKKQGAILTLDDLQTAIKNSKAAKKINLHYLKRLQRGLINLEKAWRKNYLQNSELQKQFDQNACDALRKILKENQEEFPAIRTKLYALRETEIKAWFENQGGLSSERQEAWDKMLHDQIYAYFIDYSNDENTLSSTLIDNLEQVLLKKFQTGELPEFFNISLNHEILSNRIYEILLSRKESKALGTLIVSELNLMKKTSNYNPEKWQDFYRKAASQVSEKWFKGELIDQKGLEAVNKIARKILGKVSIGQQGELYSVIKKEAVNILFLQFRDGVLPPFAQVMLEERIRNALFQDKYTETQKESVIHEVMEDFKADKLDDLKLIGLISGFLSRWIEDIEDQIDKCPQKDHNRFFNMQTSKDEVTHPSTGKVFGNG